MFRSMTSNRFVFIVPMFNASKTLARCLHSVVGQSYENWKIIFIDDVSTWEERCRERLIIERFKDLLKAQKLDHERLQSIWNDEKRWEVANVLEGIKLCNDDDIVCRLDADDFLTDLDALRILNDVYTSGGFDVVWSLHRWHDENHVTFQNISGHLPNDADPYEHPWVTSHFKTFRKRLLNNVNDANYRGSDGEYFKRIGDQAFMLPALKQARGNWFHLPLVLYSYYCKMVTETFQSDDAKFQKAEAEFLRNRGFIE